MRLVAPALALLVTATALHCAPDAVLVEPPGSGGAGGTGGDGGMGAGPCPAYANIPVVDCDLLAQDCPPPQRCAIAAQNGHFFTYCIQPNGGKTTGEPCMASGECEYGMACLFGACSAVCCFDTDEPCGDTGFCLGRTTYGPYFTYRCIYPAACEVLTPAACEGAMPPGDCHLIPFHARSACLGPSPDGIHPEGTLCEALNECGESQVCFPFESAGASSCRFNCFLDGSGSATPGLGGCPPGQSCTDQGLDQPSIGICLP
jgi:hypothetical protein